MPDGSAGELAARGAECTAVRRVAVVAAVLVGLGTLLAHDASIDGHDLRSRDLDARWSVSLAVLGLLLIALQLVVLLFVLEHQVTVVANRIAQVVALLPIWVVRAAIVLVCWAAVAWAHPPGWLPVGIIPRRLAPDGTASWSECYTLLWQAEAVVAAALLAQWLWDWFRQTNAAPQPALPASAPPEPASKTSVGCLVAAWGLARAILGKPLGKSRRTESPPPLMDKTSPMGRRCHASTPDVPPLVAIGASGGGIRAAAFVLGGHQAVQDCAPGLHINTPDDEPHVYAVSGGSYIAAAMALSRRYRPVPSGGVDYVRGPDETRSWAGAYNTASPELERLRRHTQYLYEPGSRLRDGLVTLLIGAVINLFLLVIAVRFVVWASIQVAVTLGLVDDAPTSSDPPTLHFYAHLAAALSVPVAAAGVAGLLTVLGWASAAWFDQPGAAGSGSRAWRSFAATGIARSVWRPVALTIGAGWLMLVVGLPGATVGIVGLAVDNQPTTTGARVLTSVGLVSRGTCADAFQQHVLTAIVQANHLAQVDPGTPAAVTAGACGHELTVHRTADVPSAQDDVDYARGFVLGRLAPDDDAQPTGSERRAIDHHLTDSPFDVSFQIGGIGVLLTLVGGLLRKAAMPGTVDEASWRSRLTARLVRYVPVAAMALVLTYLSLIWARALLTRIDSSYLWWAAVLTVAACVVGFLVDPNVTSMHRYYRNSLASAFAVGVDDTTEPQTAEALDPRYVYRFSELAPKGVGPRLHIVATLNTQMPGDAPTLRRGVPGGLQLRPGPGLPRPATAAREEHEGLRGLRRPGPGVGDGDGRHERCRRVTADGAVRSADGALPSAARGVQPAARGVDPQPGAHA